MTIGSTYRLQLNGLGFDGARRLVPYLAALGVEVLYVSPILAAVPHSTHGYDVADPTRIDPDLGGPDELESLLAELDRHRMRLLLDVVPNHMAASPANPWWWDVLYRGPDSPFAHYFDIDWSEGPILLPVLAAPLAEVIDAGEISIKGSAIAYHDLWFPLAPRSLSGDLEEVLGHQHYRLSYWRLGNSQGSYRRFFDVDGLVGCRVEDPLVYEATHRLVLQIAADDRVAGLRVDHVDGLADPAGYLRRLRNDLPSDSSVVVEKIVARGEDLPSTWPVDGMTGYEFADLAGGLLVNPDGAARLAAADFGPLAVDSKTEVLETLFQGQVDRLARAAITAAGPGADIGVHDMAGAVLALSADLPVYRTYLPPDGRAVLAAAAARASTVLGPEGVRALDVLVDGMLENPGRWAAVTRRWQQLTGAVAGKGVEDTALYRFDGLLAAAEVGGNPGEPAVEVAAFHRAMQARSRGGLNATSTHDSKLGEDVRARLAVLSEMPVRWERTVARWRRRNRSGLSSSDEHRLYQVVVGTWPPGTRYVARMQDYMVKAAREAKRETSWIDPDETYEEQLGSFVARLLGPSSGGRAFTADVARLVSAIGPAGATNALALAVLRSTAPGVPDLYQGTELWSPTLVDPDNRRRVDFTHREGMLGRLQGDLLGSWEDGRVKMAVVTRLLHLRRREPTLFSRGTYLPLSPRGPARTHVVAFARRWRKKWSLTIVPRQTFGLAGPGRFPLGEPCWGDTMIPLPPDCPRTWRDPLGGVEVDRPLHVADLLRLLPVAVLVPA